MEMTEAKRRDFLNQWACYKWSSGVSGQDSVDDLVLCLPDELRLEVTSELEDSLENIMEEDLMWAIKRMAVLISNPMVHRNQMSDHRQGDSEKVQGFVARVREAAIEYNAGLETFQLVAGLFLATADAAVLCCWPYLYINLNKSLHSQLCSSYQLELSLLTCAGVKYDLVTVTATRWGWC